MRRYFILTSHLIVILYNNIIECYLLSTFCFCVCQAAHHSMFLFANYIYTSCNWTVLELSNSDSYKCPWSALLYHSTGERLTLPRPSHQVVFCLMAC